MADIAAAVREAESIRKVATGDAKRVATALMRAFHDDPAFAWVTPELDRRERAYRGFFELGLGRVWLGQGTSYTTGGVVGAAVWEPPGEWKLSAAAQLRLLPGMLRVWRRDAPRALRALAKMESNHPRERHWYLAFIGVEPEWQGRGLGAALLRPMLERCDRERMPAYLEASSPKNRPLYERHGFQVTEEFRFAKDGPPLWRMWREPRG